MRPALETIKHIEKYLRQELSPDQLLAFKQQLNSNPNLRAEVDLQNDILKAIENLGIKDDIQKAERKYFRNKKRFWIILLLSFLATVVTGLLVFYPVKDSTSLLKPPATQTPPIVPDSVKVDSIQITTMQPPTTTPGTVKETQESASIKLPQVRFQRFHINSSKAETIVGKHGTSITFPENAFEAPKNTTVLIKLKEYYKSSDIAFSNLTTMTTDAKQLETGGMIYLEAIANNQKLALRKNQSFMLKFPFKDKKPSMLLFEGIEENGNVLWKLAKKVEESTSSAVDELESYNEAIEVIFVENSPVFPGGEQALFRHLRKNTRYPQQAKDQDITGQVFVSVLIDTFGKVTQPIITGSVHPLLDEEALRVVQTMPKWTPAVQSGVKIPCRMQIPMRFRLYGDSEITPLPTKLVNKKSKIKTKAGIERDLFDAIDSSASTEDTNNRNIQDIKHYLFSSSKLGWINCDRFVNSPASKIDMTVNVAWENADITLIFHRYRSMMKANYISKNHQFRNVPQGESATLVAIKVIDGHPHMAVEEIKTSTAPVDLKFRKLTKEQLHANTKAIDSI